MRARVDWNFLPTLQSKLHNMRADFPFICRSFRFIENLQRASVNIVWKKRIRVWGNGPLSLSLLSGTFGMNVKMFFFVVRNPWFRERLKAWSGTQTQNILGMKCRQLRQHYNLKKKWNICSCLAIFFGVMWESRLIRIIHNEIFRDIIKINLDHYIKISWRIPVCRFDIGCHLADIIFLIDTYNYK